MVVAGTITGVVVGVVAGTPGMDAQPATRSRVDAAPVIDGDGEPGGEVT